MTAAGGACARIAAPVMWVIAAGVVLLAACSSPAPAGTAVTVAVPTPVPFPAPSVMPVPAASGEPSPVAPPPLACQESEPAMTSMPSPGHMPAGSTMAEIARRGYLIAGVDQANYTQGFPNPSPSSPGGEEFEGYNIDFVHAIAQAIFGDPDAVLYVPVKTDYRLGASNQGVVDLAADDITVTCDRTKQVNFSIDYFDAAQRLLVDRTNSAVGVSLDARKVPHVHGLKNEKVCAVATSTAPQVLLDLARNGGGFSIVLATDWSDCLAMLQQGAVQAVDTDDTILAGLQAEDPFTKLVGAPFSIEQYGIAFPMHDPAAAGTAGFVGFVNAVILRLESDAGRSDYCPEQRLENETCWAALYRRWMAPQLGPSPPAIPRPRFQRGAPR
jgi:polar amino acid transport system substrate-binding protein